MNPNPIHRIPILILTLILTVSALHCQNPFAMRKAETPGTGKTVWEPARSPAQLLENFSKSISEQDAEKYKRCLVDTVYSSRIFRFDPDPAVEEIYPTLFDAWSTDMEVEVMRQVFHLVPDDSVSQLNFTLDVRETLSADSAEYIKQYSLELHHDQEDLPTSFEGQIHLRMIEDSRGEWVIYFWNDRNIFPEKQGWSDLKAVFGG